MPDSGRGDLLTSGPLAGRTMNPVARRSRGGQYNIALKPNRAKRRQTE
jgi:hypothetical protein